MTLGGKHKEDKPNHENGPGKYQTEEGLAMTKPRSYEAYIKPYESPKKEKEQPPEAGEYDPHTDFGYLPQNMTLGGKYKPEKPNDAPPVGCYDTDIGEALTKPRSVSAFIKEDNGIKVVREQNPDAGMYEPFT